MKVKENMNNDLLCYFVIDGKNTDNWEQLFAELVIPEFTKKVNIVQLEIGPYNPQTNTAKSTTRIY